MIVKHTIDKKTRLVEKFHFPALTEVVALEKKRWYGWRTVSWIPPVKVDDKNKNTISEYLDWKGNKNNPSHTNNQRVKDTMLKKYIK